MDEVIALTTVECEGLLRDGVGGRIALAAPDGPHIVPVNYSVVDDAIIVRTSPYSVLGTYGRDRMLAFEVDRFDRERRRGWSVLARGRGEVVEDADELAHIRAIWEPRPWAAGARTLHVRLRWSELSGRRVSAVEAPVRVRPEAG